jgi:hypothetical protein
MRNLFTSFVLVLLLPVYDALACSCSKAPSPCEAYQAADAVFIGVVKKVEPELSGQNMVYNNQTAYVQVEKGFKQATAGDEFVLHQPSHNCAPKFKAGERYLLYASLHKDSKTWEVYGCGRSRSAESAPDDLSYLENLSEAVKQTRLSGTLKHYEEGFSLVKLLPGIKVSVVGQGKSYEAYTNQHGVYEVYGLPEGKYEIKPEIPPTSKVRFPMPFGPVSYTNERSLQVELKVGSCAGVDFVLSSDTAITGKVYGVDGKPMPNVCLKLIAADVRAPNPYFKISDCTEKDGAYRLDEVPPGRYIILANYDGKMSGDAPFRPTYYPGVFDKEKAAVITVGEGQKLDSYDIHVPEQFPTVVLKGVLLYSDGKPVQDEHVEFEVDDPKEGGEQVFYSRTDEQGRFSLKVVQGVAGSLRGEVTTYSGEYENCPEVEKLIVEKGERGMADLQTKTVRIDGTNNVQNIKLILPFRSCKKRERK